jgi:hypothetical protein
VIREKMAEIIPNPNIRRIEADRCANFSNLVSPSIRITRIKIPMGKCTKTG